MADLGDVVAESPIAVDTALVQEHSTTTLPTGQDTPLSDGADVYKPLPIGSWIIPFHGTCPRCHHYHKAVQIKIKVTQDSNHASYVHCDKCKDPWAVFSARNATQGSLLSTLTSEVDLIAREVRYRLIDIVNLATARAANERSNISASTVPLQQHSIDTRLNDDSVALSSPPTASRRNEYGPTAESAPQIQGPTSVIPPSIAPPVSSKQRGNLSRMLSKVKKKLAARVSMLYRGHGEQSAESPNPNTMLARQLDKSTVAKAPVSTADTAAVKESTVVPQLQDDSGHQEPPVTVPSTATVTAPPRLAEVATFIASLDQSELDCMTEEERRRWMRKAYTDFKARNKRSRMPIALSPIVETSIMGELPTSPEDLNRRSQEVRYTGGHLEGLEFIPRRFSTTSSVATLDADDSTMVNTVVTAPGNSVRTRIQQLRHGSNVQRPQSMPNAGPLPRRLHQRGRGSFDSRMYGRVGSTSSLRGHAASLRSQDSFTLNGSVISLNPTSSRDTTRPTESVEGSDLPNQDPLPSPSFTVRDRSESPPPPQSLPHDSPEGRR